MMENKCLMIEDKCSIVDIPCISGEIGEKCKNGGAVICPASDEYMERHIERAIFGKELDDGLRELINDPEYGLAYSLSIAFSIMSKQRGKEND